MGTVGKDHRKKINGEYEMKFGMWCEDLARD